jgi:hypothetical protein
MKKILLGGLITIITLALLSYTTTDGGGTSANQRMIYKYRLNTIRAKGHDCIA